MTLCSTFCSAEPARSNCLRAVRASHAPLDDEACALAPPHLSEPAPPLALLALSSSSHRQSSAHPCSSLAKPTSSAARPQPHRSGPRRRPSPRRPSRSPGRPLHYHQPSPRTRRTTPAFVLVSRSRRGNLPAPTGSTRLRRRTQVRRPHSSSRCAREKLTQCPLQRLKTSLCDRSG